MGRKEKPRKKGNVGVEIRVAELGKKAIFTWLGVCVEAGTVFFFHEWKAFGRKKKWK